MEIVLRDVLPEDAPALAHIVVSANEHAFRGRVPDQCLAFSEAESAANWRSFFNAGLPAGDFMLVAQAPGSEVVGYAWGGAFDDTLYTGELRQIMVLPAYQGLGIGSRLLRAVAQRLSEQQNIHSLRVEVLAVNPNRLFYEHMGAELIAEGVYDWDGVTLTKHVYGWKDTLILTTTK